MNLRPYQISAKQAAFIAWETMRRILLVLATGTGKTVIFADVAAEMVKTGRRVMVLVHRSELANQAADKLKQALGVSVEIEMGESRSDESGIYGKSPVVVGSIQSLYGGDSGKRRLSRFDPSEFGLVIADEAHHSTADSWKSVIDYFLSGSDDCRLLGVTATPDRNDDRNLGTLYQSVPYSYDLRSAARDGFLVPIRQRSVIITGLDFSTVRTKRAADGGRDFVESELEAAMMLEKPVQQVASATIELAYGLPKGSLLDLINLEDAERQAGLAAMVEGRRRRRTLLFCVSVNHAQLMASVLNRWFDTTVAASVDGGTSSEDRADRFKAFRSGEVPFLANCAIATEGTDLPATEVVVVARPTKSRSLFAQMVGRGSRPLTELANRLGDMADAGIRRAAIAASDKPYCEVLDFTDNSRRHDLVSPIDLVACQDDDALIVERAKELADEQDVTPEDALAEAEIQIEAERALAVMIGEEAEAELEASNELQIAEWRKSLVGGARYEVDERETGHIGGSSTVAVRGGSTDKQVDFLVKLGVRRETAMGYGKRQAGAVIEKLKGERCTVGQRRKLLQLQVSAAEIDAMDFESASEAINSLVGSYA